MRILLLSDLHFREPWYQWVSAQKADLTIIAGDLMDGFHKNGRLPQILFLVEWCQRFEGQLALSSGNHDGNDDDPHFDLSKMNRLPMDQRERVRRLISEPHWMDHLERSNVVTDRRTAVVETLKGKIIVSTIPFCFLPGSEDPATDGLFREGAILRKKLKIPWIVVHHDPPADTKVGGLYGDTRLFYLIREYNPDFVISGHPHSQPYTGSFADNLGETWCFNPGCPEPAFEREAKFPNHILLDLKKSTAIWYATSNVTGKPMHQQISLR